MTKAEELRVTRYGETERDSPHFLRRIAIAVAIVGLGVAVWLGWGFAQPKVDFTTVSYNVVSATEANVTFDVMMPAGRAATCSLEALNVTFAQVGVLEVYVAPSDHPRVRLERTLATSELAVTVVVRDCTLLEQGA